MSKRRFSRMYAQFVQTLVYYDGPQLALFKNRKGAYILASRVGEEVSGLDDPFFAVVTPKKLLDSYLDQKIDLNFALRSRRAGGSFLFSWPESGDSVMMERVENLNFDFDVDSFYPEPGFFARSHTHKFDDRSQSSLSRHSYYIDGRWTANDFSKFYSKLSDLYAIFSIFTENVDSQAERSIDLRKIISQYPYQGGGSYLSVFKDIRSEANDNYPLQVSKIQYASPGEIEVLGVDNSLVQIDKVISRFSEKSEELRKIYGELREVLKEDGVLTRDALEFSNPATARLASLRATPLLEGLGLPSTDMLLVACGNHLVVFSKLALAIYRRAEQLHAFYAEGRMDINDRR